MIREPRKPIIIPEDVKPSRDFLKVDGVFNCGAAKLGDEYILLCRVAESCREQEEGYVNIPVYDERAERLKIERISLEEIRNRYDMSDSRMIYRKNAGGIKKIKYLTSISHLRLARSRDGIHFKMDEQPALPLQGRYERWGMEDPRITYMEEEGRYCITYTAVSDLGVMPALLITEDFEEYERIGAIFPPENKDVTIFPRKIGGLYYACHRPVPCEIGTPDIWISSSPDLLHWGEHRHLCGVSEEGWENGRIGSGAVASVGAAGMFMWLSNGLASLAKMPAVPLVKPLLTAACPTPFSDCSRAFSPDAKYPTPTPESPAVRCPPYVSPPVKSHTGETGDD